MAVNKLVFDGITKFDLSNDTVTPETLLKGVTAHDASGELIVGTMDIASQFEKASFSSNTFSLNSGGSSTVTINVTKSGYTPVACVGLRSLADSRLNFYRWDLSGSTLTVSVYNISTSKLNNMQVSAQMLFIKNA